VTIHCERTGSLRNVTELYAQFPTVESKEKSAVQNCSVIKDELMNRVLALLLALFCTGPALFAQSNTPILSGTVAFLGSTTGGANTYEPFLSPVLAFPIGDHWLIESRAEIEGFIARQNGTSGPYNGQYFDSLDYAQVDYIANSHLTVVVGRFLTPFNIYNERFPVWIANLEDSPIIYPIGTRTSGSSNGGMVRGVAVSREKWIVNYTAYFSAAQTTENLRAGRAAGGRVGVFLPQAGLEVGASYQRFLQNGGYNASGAYWSWQPPQIPLDVRGEYAHSPGGHGYWLEAAFKLGRSRDSSTWLSRLQPVARVQQFFKGTPIPGDVLPNANVNQYDFGLNYYFPHYIRLNGSYGRQYTTGGNANIWNFGLTYRFLFPAWPGAHQ